MRVTIAQACEQLRSMEDVLILTHQSPDGDTIGSGLGLWHILTKLGKRARVECADPFSAKYSFITDDYVHEEFSHKHIVCVDIADTPLLGKALEKYKDSIDLCIDHHPSNTHFAKALYLDEKAAATAEMIMDIARELQFPLDTYLAKCVYTGMVTDTGCFRYGNTTPKLLRMAADVLETGIEAFVLNRILLEEKSPQRMQLDKLVLDTLDFYYNNRLVMISVTRDMIEQSGASEDDLDGVTMLTRQIAGIQLGLILREKEDGTVRVSARSTYGINASQLCAAFGGGGHRGAAGCTIRGSIEQVKQILLQATAPYLERTAKSS